MASFSIADVDGLDAEGPGGMTMIAIGAPRGGYQARGPF